MADPVPGTAELLAQCTFPPTGTEVTCAVSGGSDSMSLMILAVSAGCAVTAVHVDHGLRCGSVAEADVVAAAAARFGATFRAVTVDVARGPNLEARARAARYAALPAGVMTGHTADDQAETVLLNLMRGAAGSGLAAMRPGFRRPLLRVRRSALAQLCRALDVTVVDDPSNRDPSHLRNRVRHELLPLLDELAQRDLVPVLARQADLLRAESDLLDDLAGALDPTDAKLVAAAPIPLARRALRRWLSTDHPPDSAAVERVLAVARGEAASCDIGAGRRVERTRQRMRLFEESSAQASR